MATSVFPARPFSKTISAMKAKDPELYDRIKDMRPSIAFRIWQDKHPEDFRKAAK